MPFTRPTLTALRAQAMQDITASDLPGADGLLRRSVLRVLGWVQAGLAHLHYGFLDWISRQSVPYTATDEFLEGWAALKGVLRKPATKATGLVVFSTATDPITVPAGTPVFRSDQVAYVVTAPAISGSGSVTVPIAAVDVGSGGTFASHTDFTLGNAINGVTSAASDSTAVTEGTDVETDAELRTRMLLAYAAPPQGGDVADYVEWALAVPGVTRAWVTQGSVGSGALTVLTMFDAPGTDGVPTGTPGVATGETRDTAATGDLLTVADAIFPKRPVTALVYSAAPTLEPTNFDIALADVSKETDDNLAKITAALNDMFLRIAVPLNAIDPLSGSVSAVIKPSVYYEVIASVPDLGEFQVFSPAGQIEPGGGLLSLGTVAWD